jgi:ATP-dependent Clp protease ATP-binding subunit ClpC
LSDSAGASSAGESEDPSSPSAPAETPRDASRSARVHVLLSEQPDGRSLVHPIVAPLFASYGDEDNALAEQSLFLRALLSRAPPADISRLSLPDGARLHDVGVVLPRDDLPRRLQSDVEVMFSCVVIPTRAPAATSAPNAQRNKRAGDRWIIVPRIGHTFYVEHDEPLDDAIRSEIRRVIGSQEVTPWELLGLFPARAHRIETLEIALEDRPRAGASASGSLRRIIAEKARRKQAVEVLSVVATPLHVTERSASPPPLVARETELAQLQALLEGKERMGVLLLGPEHAGKTALVRAFLAGSGSLVYATSGAQLVAGMSGLGEWQERIREVMEAIQTLNATLYFEDLEDLLIERSESGGVDFAGGMRPWLDEGKVRILGELRSDRLDTLEGRHAGFFALLSRLRVEPLTPANTLIALQKRAAHDARNEARRPRVELDALPTLVDLAERYLPHGSFPGKAVRLYNDLRSAHDRDPSIGGPSPVLGRKELYRVFSLSTGVPEFLLRDDSALRVEDLSAALSKQIIGQEPAIAALAATIGVIKAGLQPAGKPLATFLFVGPTGVGKTELARALADLLFQSPERMVRFDMSEFMTPDAAERLIRGTDRSDGLLTRRVREQPFCVILLDEIEKAHPAVFDLLLQVCGEGRLTDAAGRTAYFHNAILIMTSNLGAAEKRTRTGFGSTAVSDEAHYQRLANATFRQEFVNRIDHIVPFRALTRPEVQRVARLGISRMRRRRGLDEAGVVLDVSEAAIERFGDDGYSELYGARALRRHLDEHLAGPLSRQLANLGAESKDVFIDVSLATEPETKRDGILITSTLSGPFRLDFRRKKSVKASQQVHGESEIARLRRDVDRMMALAPVEQVKDQIDFLVTQLGAGSEVPKKHDRRWTQEQSELQAEHHRLQALFEKLVLAQEEAHSVEEIAILALFEGQEVVPFLEDARAAHRNVLHALPYVMLALEPHRDAITWILEELDEDAFDIFLPSLLREIEARGWSALVHIDGGERVADDQWPADRRWGPPRSIAALREALSAPKRSFRGVVLRVKGSYAGVLLALEAGLHRIEVPPRAGQPSFADNTAHVEVRTLLFSFDIPKEAWAQKSMGPPTPATASHRRRGQAVRERKSTDHTVLVAGKRARVSLDPAQYWAHLEEIALAHLLLFEREDSGLDRDDWLAAPGDAT